MSKLELNELNALHFDVLKEIANIGAGNATTALSKMLNAKVDMKVPCIQFMEFKELAEGIGGAENLVVGILLTLDIGIEGMMMFVLERDSAEQIVNLLMGKSGKLDEFTEMDLSALQEIGNIIAGSYLSAISAFTNMTISASVPYLSIDMAGAILSVPAIEFSKISDKALLIETEFGDKDTIINGYFILIPTLDAFATIFSAPVKNPSVFDGFPVTFPFFSPFFPPIKKIVRNS